MGTAVKVHPLAVVFAVAAVGFLAGIPGALFAVPVIAVPETWSSSTSPRGSGARIRIRQ